MSSKSDLRLAIKERLSRMSENDRRVESQIIVRELKKILPSGPLAAYLPYVDEPNITPLLTELLQQKNVICMPKVEGNHLMMHQIFSLEEVRKNPATGILEPETGNAVDESTIAAVIVPGRAFTAGGVRLGRGNGGYDRWISEQKKRNPATQYIGVCFDCQLLTEIPTEAHDEKVDCVVTPAKVFSIHAELRRAPESRP